jgi:hypothetical protein
MGSHPSPIFHLGDFTMTNVELKPTSLNPAFKDQWKNVEAAETLSKTRREQEVKNNPPGPPTDDQLRAEWSTLEQSHRELTHYAAQSEASTNAQADHVRLIEKRLKATEELIPEDIREATITKFQAGERVYRLVEACRGVVALREVLKEANDLFARKRRISADFAARKTAFEQHNFPRLLELREIVKKQDNNYATSKGRKSVWQY